MRLDGKPTVVSGVRPAGEVFNLGGIFPHPACRSSFLAGKQGSPPGVAIVPSGAGIVSAGVAIVPVEAGGEPVEASGEPRAKGGACQPRGARALRRAAAG